MKKYVKILLPLILVISMQSCSDNVETTDEKQKVQFSFALGSANGRLASTTLPAGTSLRVSIIKTNGQTIFNLHEMELLQVGNSLMTTPIELANGSYKVTDFVLVDASQRIIFATPKRGSAMAALVTKPVNYSFGVKKSLTTTLPMEVVDASQSLAEDFGYVTFDLNLSHPLSIGVYAPGLTTAQAYILEGEDTLQYFNLAAITNVLPFLEETSHTYTLTVIKDGFTRYTKDFVYNDLITSLGGAPLKITLTPAFTFRAISSYTIENWFHAKLNGTPGKKVNVNWGDGTTESFIFDPSFPDDYKIDLDHTFPHEGVYFVNITGDLKDITAFNATNDEAMFSKINFETLTNLNHLAYWLMSTPATFDLTHNTKLEMVETYGLFNTTKISLPFFNKIRFIDVGGPNDLTAGSLTDIINTVHHAAVADNRHNGNFSFTKDWEAPDMMVITPTPAALAKLRVLRDTYGWTITPNP